MPPQHHQGRVFWRTSLLAALFIVLMKHKVGFVVRNDTWWGVPLEQVGGEGPSEEVTLATRPGEDGWVTLGKGGRQGGWSLEMGGRRRKSLRGHRSHGRGSFAHGAGSESGCSREVQGRQWSLILLRLTCAAGARRDCGVGEDWKQGAQVWEGLPHQAEK